MRFLIPAPVVKQLLKRERDARNVDIAAMNDTLKAVTSQRNAYQGDLHRLAGDGLERLRRAELAERLAEERRVTIGQLQTMVAEMRAMIDNAVLVLAPPTPEPEDDEAIADEDW